MTKNKRWIKSVIETAKSEEAPTLPWQRGSRRAEMIVRRDEKKAVTPARRHA